MTHFILTIVIHTPRWVCALLAALIASGLRQTHDQVVSKPRLLIQPALLGLLSLAGASATFGLHLSVQPMWLLGGVVGLAISRSLGLPRRLRPMGSGRFAVAGSWVPLILTMSIFALRYLSSATLAIVPQLAGDLAFAAATSLLYGLPAGLFAARALPVLGVAGPALPEPAV